MVKLPGLHDTLEFSAAGAFQFVCDDPTVPSDGQNLVVRAARAYEAATSRPCRQKVVLRKSIPHGAGLGGGSSDAATTLLGLEKLNPDPLGAGRLSELAAALGSDVPFFLHPGAAICTGRGETIKPVEGPPLRVLLLKPGFGVATPDAYGRWSGAKEVPGISYASQPLTGVTLSNDLERPVFSKHRFLAELKQWLRDREDTDAALMSGSGATVFAVLREGANAGAIADEARQSLDPGLWSWSGETGPNTPIQNKRPI